MKKRPLILTLYSFMLVGTAVSFPMQILYAYEIPIHKIFYAVQFLTWLNLAVIGFMVATSIAVAKASRLTLILAPATVILVCLNNYWVGYVGVNYTTMETTVASFVFAATTCFLLERNARIALFDPHSRWWLTPRRRHIEKQIILLPWNGETVSAFTHDISEFGAFVKTDGGEFSVGDRMQIRMKIDGHIDIRCTGRLVRKSDGAGQYPAGLAVEFEDITRQERRLIRDLVYT